MASRMERYHQREERSVRNEQLYKNIENLDNYTNIEGVISIDKTNEIDITRVKAMLQSREGYQQEKKYRQLVPPSEKEEEEVSPMTEEVRTYDIRDVLTKAKETRPEVEEYRTPKDMNYDVSTRLSPKISRRLQEEEEDEVKKELVDTVTIPKPDFAQNADESSGLFDDLKSNTMVGDPSSIKKIIEEAKKEEEKQEEEKKISETTNLENIDKTFFTSSLGFTDSDFEDLKSLGQDIKKHNVLLRILIGILVIAVLVAGIIFLIQILNK